LVGIIFDLDFHVQKFLAGTFACQSACGCVLDSKSANCDPISFLDSQSSDFPDVLIDLNLERYSASQPYYSYLISVHIPLPNNPAWLRLSNAQVRAYSLASGRVPEAASVISLVPPPILGLPVPSFWVVCCLFYNTTTGALTYRNVKNTSSSVFTISSPDPQAYCQ